MQPHMCPYVDCDASSTNNDPSYITCMYVQQHAISSFHQLDKVPHDSLAVLAASVCGTAHAARHRQFITVA